MEKKLSYKLVNASLHLFNNIFQFKQTNDVFVIRTNKNPGN